MTHPSHTRSKEIDLEIQAQSLRLKDFTQVIPTHLKTPVEWRSWLCLLRVISSMGLCLFVLQSIPLSFEYSLVWSIPTMIGMWFIYGLILLGFFLVGHECGHGSFSKYNWVNQLIGTLCMAPFFNGFKTWVLTHNHHHTFTQVNFYFNWIGINPHDCTR